MAAFDDLNFAAGADKFSDFYTKYNASMDALKAGTSNFVLVGGGAGSAPAYQSFWSSFIVVGSGGSAPAYGSNFQAIGSGDNLRFRKSIISNTIEISGRFKRITSVLAAGFSATIFTLPAGYLPTVANPAGTLRVANSNNDSVTLIIDGGTGNVILVNTLSSSIAINTFMDITFRFPIS